LTEVQRISTENNRLDAIIFAAEFQEIVQVTHLKNVRVEPHLACVLYVVTHPLVDEGVAILLRVQVQAVSGYQIE
jgi:hypothetical protein